MNAKIRACLFATASLHAATASAQTDTASTQPTAAEDLMASARPAEEDGTQSYDSAYFAQSNVQNAEDMLRRLPGVPAILDAAGQVGTQQARGLGSGGDQILIDGKRLASKNQILPTLRRITASSVARIELIRGTSSKVDVQSEGLIVNIVFKEGAGSNRISGNWELNYRFDNMGWSGVDGLAAVSGNLGDLDYVFGAERNLWTPLGTAPSGGGGDYTKRARDEVYFYPNGAVQELRPQSWFRHHDKRIFTTNLTYSFGDGNQLRFNGRYQPHIIDETATTPFTRFAPGGAVSLQGIEIQNNRQRLRTIDLGGEYQRKIGAGSFSLIALHTRVNTRVQNFRNQTFPTGTLTEISKSANYQRTGEDVLRATYSFPLGKGHSLTFGLEGSRNTIEQNLSVFFDFDRDGRLEPVVNPIALAKVSELRGEAFITHNWQIDTKLSLESTINFETSRITTNYPLIPAHSYTFPKPRIDLRYNVSKLDRLRFKIERTISQLEFNNFIPVYNIVDQRIDAGNPEIEPQKTWIFELGGEHRLPGDNGSIEIKGFARLISGQIERGPFGIAASGLPFSAPVNIDNARNIGGEFKWGVRLAALGLRDVQFNGRYLRQFTRLKDPFTGRDRTIKDPWGTEFNVGLRHDLARLGLSYGANYVDTVGYQITSDIRNLDYYSRGERFDIFVEKALPHRLSLRIEAWNLAGSPEYKRRTLYTVSQANGTVLRTETYQETRDRRFAIRLRGQF
jgi:outer membrane receptor for ferrienterochelin and colicins